MWIAYDIIYFKYNILLLSAAIPLYIKIESIEMGYMETDRPAPITRDTLTSNDSRLKQKGKRLDHIIIAHML